MIMTIMDYIFLGPNFNIVCNSNALYNFFLNSKK